MAFTGCPTNRWCITSEGNFLSGPSSRTSEMEQASAPFATARRLTPPWALLPTGGIPMGTRSGDLDPGVLLYLMRVEKLGADELEQLLNHQSGLLALSGGESDVKALEERPGQ